MLPFPGGSTQFHLIVNYTSLLLLVQLSGLVHYVINNKYICMHNLTYIITVTC